MFDFIKRHWVAYLIGALAAAALGLGVSHIAGEKFSTPPEIRAERIKAEQTHKKDVDQMAKDSSVEESKHEEGESPDKGSAQE